MSSYFFQAKKIVLTKIIVNNKLSKIVLTKIIIDNKLSTCESLINQISLKKVIKF